MNTIQSPPLPNQITAPLSIVSSDDALRDAAKKLEVSFLSEMLKSAGFDRKDSSFSGGIGEEQFNSFLRQSQAERMVDAGGIGLAESLFNAMKRVANA